MRRREACTGLCSKSTGLVNPRNAVCGLLPFSSPNQPRPLGGPECHLLRANVSLDSLLHTRPAPPRAVLTPQPSSCDKYPLHLSTPRGPDLASRRRGRSRIGLSRRTPCWISNASGPMPQHSLEPSAGRWTPTNGVAQLLQLVPTGLARSTTSSTGRSGSHAAGQAPPRSDVRHRCSGQRSRPRALALPGSRSRHRQRLARKGLQGPPGHVPPELRAAARQASLRQPPPTTTSSPPANEPDTSRPPPPSAPCLLGHLRLEATRL
jgi:hypothetical protein